MVIDAARFADDQANRDDLIGWIKAEGGDCYACHAHADSILGIMIGTLEGSMLAAPGDYIIKGVKGEFYPCKPDIFCATYEREYKTGECRRCGTIYPIMESQFCPQHGYCLAKCCTHEQP